MSAETLFQSVTQSLQSEESQRYRSLMVCTVQHCPSPHHRQQAARPLNRSSNRASSQTSMHCNTIEFIPHNTETTPRTSTIHNNNSFPSQSIHNWHRCPVALSMQVTVLFPASSFSFVTSSSFSRLSILQQQRPDLHIALIDHQQVNPIAC